MSMVLSAGYKFLMKFLSWNIRGLGRTEKKKAVRSMVARCQADFLLLQESKLEKVENKLLKSIWGKNSFDGKVSLAVGSAGGLISI